MCVSLISSVLQHNSYIMLHCSIGKAAENVITKVEISTGGMHSHSTDRIIDGRPPLPSNCCVADVLAFILSSAAAVCAELPYIAL